MGCFWAVFGIFCFKQTGSTVFNCQPTMRKLVLSLWKIFFIVPQPNLFLVVNYTSSTIPFPLLRDFPCQIRHTCPRKFCIWFLRFFLSSDIVTIRCHLMEEWTAMDQLWIWLFRIVLLVSKQVRREMIYVVYFNQQTGAGQTFIWLKKSFNNKRKKERKGKK